MFKNFTPYVIAAYATAPRDWYAHAFVPCESTQELSAGFISPHHVVIERKVVPADAIKRRVAELADAIERETGRKPGKKQRADLADQARVELLPRAFPKRKVVPLMTDGDLLILGSTSAGDLDVVTSLLVRSAEGLTLSMLSTPKNPGSAMTEWVRDEFSMGGFDIGREVTLEGGDRTATFKGYSLDGNPEVDALVKQGHTVQSLALGYRDRIAFTLTDGLQFKGVKLLDLTFGGRESSDDADRALWAGEVFPLVRALREVLA